MGDTHELRLPDGRRVTYADHGDPAGPVVLACVGTPQSRLLPPGEAERAGTMGFRLVVPDRPGFGGSDPKPGRTLEDWPADAVALMDGLGVDRFGGDRRLRRRPVRGGVRGAAGRAGHRGRAGRAGRAGDAPAHGFVPDGPGGAAGARRDDRPAGPRRPGRAGRFFAPNMSEPTAGSWAGLTRRCEPGSWPTYAKPSARAPRRTSRTTRSARARGAAFFPGSGSPPGSGRAATTTTFPPPRPAG